MTNSRYSVPLAIAGLTVTFLFMLAAGCMIYGASSLVNDGGFWRIAGGLALLIPITWSVYLGAAVAQKTIIAQR